MASIGRNAGRRPTRKLTATSRQGRKATTFRFDPAVQQRLELLAKLKRAPLNRIVNTAVEQYVEIGLADAEATLTDLLRRIKGSRQLDPSFESAIADFVSAEAALAAQDPVEGQHRTVRSGRRQKTKHSTQRQMWQILGA